jgi:hypothetical protein
MRFFVLVLVVVLVLEKLLQSVFSMRSQTRRKRYGLGSNPGDKASSRTRTIQAFP